jgi:Zn-dependent protease/predicted transcriptional regulator
MKWSFSIGHVADIDVRVHATFFLLLLWIGYFYWVQTGDMAQVLDGLVFIIALFVCVVLHEFGHALTARHYGIRTRNITLLPIGGVAAMESMPSDPRQEIAVAIAGPMVNFLIAFIIYLFLPAAPDPVLGTPAMEVDDPIGAMSFAERLLFINLVLGIFNLLPAFPMDGGRILRAAMSLFMPAVKATRAAASIGQALAIGLGILGLMGNPFLILIALFVWIGAAGEAGYAEMKSAISRIPVTRAMLTDYDTVTPSDSLGHVVELTLRGSQKDFPVMDDGRVIAVITQQDLLRGLRDAGELGVVTQYMTEGVAQARFDEPLEDVVERLRSASCTMVAVTRDGRTIGIVNYDNLIELITLHNAMHQA